MKHGAGDRRLVGCDRQARSEGAGRWQISGTRRAATLALTKRSSPRATDSRRRLESRHHSNCRRRSESERFRRPESERFRRLNSERLRRPNSERSRAAKLGFVGVCAEAGRAVGASSAQPVDGARGDVGVVETRPLYRISSSVSRGTIRGPRPCDSEGFTPRVLSPVEMG